MTAPSPEQVIQLRKVWSPGQDAAPDELVPLIRQDLRRFARRSMYGDRAGHTLQTTVSVNGTYLPLVNSREASWQKRARFFAISVQPMRRFLVESTLTRGSQKRGGSVPKVTLHESVMGSQEKGQVMAGPRNAKGSGSER
jgi:hypothetical protein